MMAKARGQKYRVKKPGYLARPVAIEMRYKLKLRRLVDDAKAVLLHILQPRIAELGRAAGVHTDSYSSDLTYIMQLVSRTYFGLHSSLEIESVAKDYASQINRHQKSTFMNVMEKAIGVGVFLEDPKVAEDTAAFVEQNVKLITSIPKAYFDDVENKVMTGLRSGLRVEELSDIIEDRYKVPAARAELIARDQTLKFYGQLNQLRQEELGIEKYTWRGVQDDRERQMHKDLEGEVFSWDDPPVTNEAGDRNHPGQDYQCRCTAEPIIPQYGKDYPAAEEVESPS